MSTDGHELLRIDTENGSVDGTIPPEIREKFSNHELFSPVYDGGQIILEGVR